LLMQYNVKGLIRRRYSSQRIGLLGVSFDLILFDQFV
jgi:hypothetical protein